MSKPRDGKTADERRAEERREKNVSEAARDMLLAASA
jgi:hypothetical protein